MMIPWSIEMNYEADQPKSLNQSQLERKYFKVTEINSF